MKFSPIAATLCLAGSAFASPIAPIAPVAPVTGSNLALPEVAGVSPERLAQLTPGVNEIVSGLGLGGLAPKLGELASLPEVGDVVKGLNLDIEIELEISIAGLTEEQGNKVLDGLKKLVATLGLDKLAAGETPSIEGLSPEVTSKVVSALKNILTALNLGDLAPGLMEKVPGVNDIPSANEIPEVVQNVDLTQLAPDVASLITALGFNAAAPTLATFLSALSNMNLN